MYVCICCFSSSFFRFLFGLLLSSCFFLFVCSSWANFSFSNSYLYHHRHNLWGLGRINEKDKTCGNTHQRTNICMSCNTNNTKISKIWRTFTHDQITMRVGVFGCLDQISIEAEIKTYSTGKLASPPKRRQLIISVLRGNTKYYVNSRNSYSSL